MSEFGTGLRAHLEQSREREDGGAPPVPFDPRFEELAAVWRRLEALAAELAGRELALSEREAELAAAEHRLALSLAKALIDAARDANVPPPIDELAAARARRFAG